MKRAGFTMIELIFVIVILGILAAVALPKFIGVSEQAHEGKMIGFVGTLNRTVAPALWSQSLTLGDGGHLTGTSVTSSTDYDAELAKQLTVIEEFTAPYDVSKCGDTNASTNAFLAGTADFAAYKVTCTDGNATSAPSFRIL